MPENDENGRSNRQRTTDPDASADWRTEYATTADLADLVREDSDLTPAEKETTIRFAKDRDRATVFTAEAGLTRRLLTHAEFAVEEVVLADGGHAPHVEALDASEDIVVGVRGTLPVGCLKVRASSRSPGGHARVVTHPCNSRLGGAGE